MISLSRGAEQSPRACHEAEHGKVATRPLTCPRGRSRRPRALYISSPIHHFEHNFHVRHRLERYGAGRCMDFELDGPDEIAAAIAAEIGREVDYRPVATDGAARAAALIAELL